MNLDNAEMVNSVAETEIDTKSGAKKAFKLIGQYKIIKEIGKGSCATVFKGKILSMLLKLALDSKRKKVAVKQFDKMKLKENVLTRIKNEIKIMKSLNCENIIKLYDIKQTKKHYYLILEYCSGGDLDRFRGKRLEEDAVQKIIFKIAKALKVLNENHVLHRDLKLSNLLLSNKSQDAEIKLADFGLARELKNDQFAKTYCGTPLYMAPEILSRNLYDQKSDLYSVGVIIYLFLTGVFPFEASTPAKLLVVMNNSMVKFPQDLKITATCINLIKNLLQIEPQKRLGWKSFFEHPFVSTEPDTYKKALMQGELDRPIETMPLIEEEIKENSGTKEGFILNVLDNARAQVQNLLDSFQEADRIHAVVSFNKEIFDLLWKMSRKIKPLITFFIPEDKALILDQRRECLVRSAYLKVINSTNGKEEQKFELTKDLIGKIQRHPNFPLIASGLLEQYETIVSNLLGYAEILRMMKNYSSFSSLFKYSMAIAHEAYILEQSQKATDCYSRKYLQSISVIDLILTEVYSQAVGNVYLTGKDFTDFFFVDDNEQNIFNNEYLISQDITIKNVMNIRPVSIYELKYLMQIRNELKESYNMVKQRNIP